MWEPVVVAATASGWPWPSKRAVTGCGLWGSLHALAIASIAAATAHQFRPTVRTTRLLQLDVCGNRGARTGPPAGSGTQPRQHRIAAPSPTWSTKSLLLLPRHSADAPQSGVAPASHRGGVGQASGLTAVIARANSRTQRSMRA